MTIQLRRGDPDQYAEIDQQTYSEYMDVWTKMRAKYILRLTEEQHPDIRLKLETALSKLQERIAWVG